MSERTAEIKRVTKETNVFVKLCLDGSGASKITSGIGFLNHMISLLAFHARFDLELSCEGDLIIDDHHSAEDCAIALGSAFAAALGDKKGIKRFGYAYAPLDETLARSVIDVSGRPHATFICDFKGEKIGALATENVKHFFVSFANASQTTLHIDVLRGDNDHHKAEAAFKALALSLREASALDGRKLNVSVKD